MSFVTPCTGLDVWKKVIQLAVLQNMLRLTIFTKQKKKICKEKLSTDFHGWEYSIGWNTQICFVYASFWTRFQKLGVENQFLFYKCSIFF